MENKFKSEDERRKFRTAKIPYGKNSLRRKFRTAKNPYGENSYGEKSVQRNILRQKFLRRKVLQRKVLALTDYVEALQVMMFFLAYVVRKGKMCRT